MVMFNKIADILMIAGMLWVVWELVVAAKVVATPPGDDAQKIVAAVKGLQLVIERMSAQMSRVAMTEDHRYSSDDEPEDEDGRGIGSR